MKLKQYLKKHSISIKQFAKQIGASPSTIENYIYHDALPGLVMAHTIVSRTNGAISFEDLIPTKYKIKKIKKDKLASWNVL